MVAEEEAAVAQEERVAAERLVAGPNVGPCSLGSDDPVESPAPRFDASGFLKASAGSQ